MKKELKCVEFYVRNQVRHNAINQVVNLYNKMSDEAWYQIEIKVEDEIRYQVRNQVWFQVEIL